MKIERSQIKEQTLAKELRTAQESLLSGFESLLGLTERGSEDEAELLSQCLIDILAKFLETCAKKPELFYAATEKRSIWPALISLDPTIRARFRHYDPDWIRKRLHLGERTGLSYEGKKAGKAIGSQIARQLFAIIAIWRRTAPPVKINLPKELPKLMFQESSGEEPCAFTDKESALARAWSKRLPVLNRSEDVLEQWWRVMRALFVKLYGSHFENRKEFAAYWKNKRYENLTDYDKRNRIRHRILKDVRQGLRSIADRQP